MVGFLGGKKSFKEKSLKSLLLFAIFENYIRKCSQNNMQFKISIKIKKTMEIYEI